MRSTAIKSPKMPPPEFTLTANELPAIKDWKVGGKYKVQMSVEQVGADKSDGKGYMPKGHSARFKILSAKHIESKKGPRMSRVSHKPLA